MRERISSGPGIRFVDAHCHLYDPELQAVLTWDSGDEQLPRIHAHVINGTHPGNWEAVAAGVSLGNSRSLAAYGVHPYFVADLPADWDSVLLGFLDRGAVSIGEIGLDFRVEPRNEALQRTIFLRQMELAAATGLPPAIHCVRAHGALLDCLRECSLPERGFLAHGFGGSREVMYQLLDLGGYVSFSAYGAHPGRKRIRDALRACPLDRLLVETDAPDMVPPADVCQFPLLSNSGRRLHHPAELITAYEWIAAIRGIGMQELAGHVEENFQRLFGGP